ncbi:MAG: HEAT repeat domain-containing protein [Candidatus Heimdallarchaeaceae archaeon]
MGKQSDIEYKKDELLNYLLSQTYHPNSDFAVFAIRSLSYFYSPRVFERLIEIIEENKDARKISEAICVLAHEQPNERMKALFLRQLTSSDEHVRTMAANALKGFEIPMLTELQNMLNDPKIKHKNKIIWLLGHKGTKETLKLLEQKKQETEDDEIAVLLKDAIASLKRIHIKFLLEDLFEEAKKVKNDRDFGE